MMNTPEPKPHLRLLRLFESLRSIPPRDPERAAAGRVAFLNQAEEYSRTNPLPAVSPTPRERLNYWIHMINPFVPYKRGKNPMFQILMAFVIALGLISGGGAVTVAAAQDSSPDDALYQVKLWTEDANLALAQSEQNKLALYTQYAETRITEIQEMLEAGEIPPEPVLARLDQQLECALQLAANQPDDQAKAALIALQTRLQTRQTNSFQTAPEEPHALEVQTQMQTMLKNYADMAAEGSEDPDWIRQQDRDRLNENLEAPTVRTENQFGQPDAEDSTPPQGSPWITDTMTSTVGITTTVPVSNTYQFQFATPGPNSPGPLNPGPGQPGGSGNGTGTGTGTGSGGTSKP